VKAKREFMKFNVYVNYNENCREAFDFYEKHLGGKILSVTTFAQMADGTNVAEERKNKIVHARIEIGGAVLMGADIPNAEPMRSAYLTLQFDEEKETERAYELLSEGGEVFMKMEKTSFANRFAMLRDRFGASWMLLCQK
jgi:PhnB protein